MADTASPALARFRLILWILVAVAAIAATALFIFKPPVRPSGIANAEFTLQSTNGGTFTKASLAGAPTLLFFGYTFCPDVCPTTLSEMTALRDDLGLKPDEMRIVFASVDPERDTLDALKLYLTSFTGVTGLTGTPAQVEAAKAAFGAISEKREDEGDGNYLINHTASVFMLDAKGQFQGTIAYGEDMDTAKAKIAMLAGR